MTKIDIRDLNDAWFTKCYIKFLLGYAELGDNGQVLFTGISSNQPAPVDPKVLILATGCVAMNSDDLIYFDKETNGWIYLEHGTSSRIFSAEPELFKKRVATLTKSTVLTKINGKPGDYIAMAPNAEFPIIVETEKFNKNKLRKNRRIIVKKLILKESSYIIASKEGITLDNKPVDIGDVVVMDPILTYDNYKVFVQEVSTTELPNLKEAVRLQKQGVKGPGVKVSNESPVEEVSFSKPSIQTRKPTPSRVVEQEDSSGWDLDKNAALRDAQYSISKRLFEMTQAGGAAPWGYLLSDNTTGETMQLADKEVFKLVRQKQIKNAKIVTKNGVDILQGIGCVLDDLEQDYKQ